MGKTLIRGENRLMRDEAAEGGVPHAYVQIIRIRPQGLLECDGRRSERSGNFASIRIRHEFLEREPKRIVLWIELIVVIPGAGGDKMRSMVADVAHFKQP